MAQSESRLNRQDLWNLASIADGMTTCGNGRGWWMRMIGEIWRLRAKVRWQAQRIRDLEARTAPPMLGSGVDAKAEPLV